MKSVMSRSALGRRVAATAVVGLAATTLGIGFAGPASAGPGTELQGTVTGVGGAPIANVDVSAVDAATGTSIETVSTDVSGHYAFTDDLVVGQVKVEFDPSPADPTLTLTSALPYQLRWSGGSRYIQGASVSSIASADPATPATVNINLPQYAAVNGSLLVGADGHAPTSNPTGVLVYDSDGNNPLSFFLGGTHDPEYDSFFDPATGNYRVVVDPASPVRLEAVARDTTVGYLSEFWKGADTLDGATPINVTAGQTVSGINFRLTNALTARQAPSISGIAAIGRPLTASPGVWSRNAGTEFSYSWMRGATVVGTGATYIPTAADFGQRLNVVVRALNGEFAGQAASAATDVVRWPADARGRAKALAGHKVRFAVKIVSAKQRPVKGKVVVLRGTKVVHKAVKLVKGKAVIIVKGQPKGKQTYTVLYKGNKLLSKAMKNFTVRIH